MPEPLRVDPTDLFLSSNHLDAHHTRHTEVHEAAHATIESSLPGWVGSSAAALQDKLAHLQQVAAHVGNELAHHRDAFQQIGHTYQNLDEDSATNIILTRL